MSVSSSVVSSSYFEAGGRVYFTVPNLFETSLCLRGAEVGDGWFFVHMKFLLTVGGDTTGVQGVFISDQTAKNVQQFRRVSDGTNRDFEAVYCR